ncbi:Uncharacterised protein [Vibrio cholerae]|nr:Uncharacterised protein [Vibrio cholerae]CSB20339.1 Uncharacterised protein [Vibrio cholerae]CSB21580.1 Uncharacterised protein [Vibrio cholerae]CSB33349.1 Uncharacterised protein [Vibrio cholerae]CSB43358.1 Uncharacterised protein [Vibrio cholerae]
MIRVGTQKLIDEITIPTVDFYTIKSCFNGTFCRLSEVVHHSINIGLSHSAGFNAIHHLAITLFIGDPNLSFNRFEG